MNVGPTVSQRIITALLTALVVAVTPLAALASSLALPHEQSANDPLVLAFYYTWFDENTWTYDSLSDLPTEPYASRDRSVMGRHIDQAKAAGIDAFLVAWYGPGSGNQTESNLAALLEEAAARDFHIGVLFETDSPFFGGVADVTGALQHLKSVHAIHPAYLRVDGRPVVFFWRPSVYGLGSWQSIRAQADPGYQSVWISEGVDTGYLQVFDGHHLYSNTWNPPTDLDATNGKFAHLVNTSSQNLGSPKLWVATVMPGHDDTRIRASGFARDRAGGGYYAQSWQAAIASKPHWIVINSFNEWPEGTYIEPSVAYGDQFIGQSAMWSSTFKGAPGPEVRAAAISPAALAPAPLPEFNEPMAIVNVALLNLRAGPSTDYEIIDRVSQGSLLPIIGAIPDRPDWWQVRQNGDQTWVYAPLVTAAGPLDTVAILEASAIPPLPDQYDYHSPNYTSYPASVLPSSSRHPLTPYLTP